MSDLSDRFTFEPGVEVHGLKPGQWAIGGDPDFIVFVSIACPDCKRLSTLQRSVPKEGTTGHRIDADGVISPSVVCPHDGCRFHEWARLNGWRESKAREKDTAED